MCIEVLPKYYFMNDKIFYSTSLGGMVNEVHSVSLSENMKKLLVAKLLMGIQKNRSTGS